MRPQARTLLLVCSVVSTAAAAQLNVGLTIQEALYPGAPTQGLERAQDPVTVGVPLPDAAGVRSIAQLGLEGSSVGQFRALGRWPSGNLKWVLVDTQADLAAGGKNTAIHLTRGGTGNFGGPDLATDDRSTITVNTGVAAFTLRKTRFNVFERVVAQGKTLIAAGNDQGLVIMGPASPNTSCPPGACTTPYLSSNDQNSCAVIEENGPARAVVKADGAYRDGKGNPYMRFTVRLHFYKNKTYVKLTTTLRNADEGASGGFTTAAKGFSSYELRLRPALAGIKKFAFGKERGIVAGNFSGSQDAYLYQAYSNYMEYHGWNAPTCPYGERVGRCVAPLIPRTGQAGDYTYAQQGFQIVEGGHRLTQGEAEQYPAGWADLSDDSGAGIEVGVYQMAAYWPKSLEFRSGGDQVRIGIWPDQTLSMARPEDAIPYYQSWPQYSIQDLYLNFHGAALTSPGTEFLKFQHFLMARAPIDYYNKAQVFFYPLLEPAEEDAYWTRLAPVYGFEWARKSPAVADRSPQVFRLYAWRSAGGTNQSETRWGWIEQWLTRGLTGRFLTAAHFYRYVAEQAFPRSDSNASATGGFHWRSHSPASDLDALGFPSNIHSLNAEYVNRIWIDQEHAHWYGMPDYYFLTGDESIKDQLLDGVADRFLNPNTIAGSGHLWSTRAVGAQLMGLARYRLFLASIGDDADLAAIDAVADATLKTSVFPELCLSGYPPGCDPTVNARGVSRTRGIASAGHDVGNDNNCAVAQPRDVRCAKPWMMGIEEEGIWEMALVRGRSWPNNRTGVANPYQLSFDLAYGMAQWTSNEAFVMGKSYQDSSLKYDLAMDYANPMNPPSATTDHLEQFEFNYYVLAQYNGVLTQAERRQFELTYLHMAAGKSFNASNIDDHDMYLTSAVIAKLLHPSRSLVQIPLRVTSNQAGNYILDWDPPPGVDGYRIKQEGHPIVDWIGFDPRANAFVGDPARTVNWFAAAELNGGANSTCPPPPDGHRCSITGLDAKPAWHFQLKAWVPRAEDRNHAP